MTLDTRAAAARVLAEVLAGRSLNQALPALLTQVAERDRGLLQQLCYGSLRHAPRLQALLGQLLDKPLRERDRDIQGLLWCGLLQLDGTRIPDHAAVAATVDGARALKKNWAGGLVNAVLRRYQRERVALLAALDAAAAASHPRWLYDTLQRQWPQAAATIIEANNAQPPMCLRVNARLQTRDAYLAQLSAAGIAARPGALNPQAVVLEQAVDVGALPGFHSGLVSVQDEAAQLAAALLQAAPGHHVLDACAAPGGKTCHILELQAQLAGLTAMDVDAARLEKVADNLRRNGLEAQLLEGDASAPPAHLAQRQFDRILVDAPCSASGVIRRHPDVKLLRRATDIAALAARQLAILRGLWPLLRPGGHLLYATCSVLEEENSRVVQQFLSATADAVAQPLRVDWGESVPGGRQLLPSVDGPDGLFYALLGKNP